MFARLLLLALSLAVLGWVMLQVADGGEALVSPFGTVGDLLSGGGGARWLLALMAVALLGLRVRRSVRRSTARRR